MFATTTRAMCGLSRPVALFVLINCIALPLIALRVIIHYSFTDSVTSRAWSCEEGNCITFEIEYFRRNVFTGKVHTEYKLTVVYPQKPNAGFTMLECPSITNHIQSSPRDCVFKFRFKDNGLVISTKDKFFEYHVPSTLSCPCSHTYSPENKILECGDEAK